MAGLVCGRLAVISPAVHAAPSALVCSTAETKLLLAQCVVADLVLVLCSGSLMVMTLEMPSHDPGQLS